MQRRTVPTQTDQDVVVVPARYAWGEYQGIHAYLCQVGRVFRSVEYMAFYTAKVIYPLVPMILDIHDKIVLERGRYAGILGHAVASFIGLQDRKEGEMYKIVLLSSPDDPRTQVLTAPLPNDLKSRSGRVTAFTQNQRYVSLASLKRAKTTSDLAGDV